MPNSNHGQPAWYELATSKGNLEAAGAFYAEIFGWSISDSGMEGFEYHIANSDGDMVAGLMVMPDDVAAIPPFWMIYFDVDDADRFAQDATAAGGRVFRPPADIPNTGRFAVMGDPQGAAFGILQADMSSMTEEEIKAQASGGAFNPRKAGHGNWHELMTTDPEAGLAFYSKLLGWQKSTAMDMGAMGTYQLFSHQGADIGGIMGLGNAPVPTWLPYFGVKGSVSAKMDAITAAGGTVHHGPAEVPGGAYISIVQDPQGAWFAFIGPEK